MIIQEYVVSKMNLPILPNDDAEDDEEDESVCPSTTQDDSQDEEDLGVDEDNG